MYLIFNYFIHTFLENYLICVPKTPVDTIFQKADTSEWRLIFPFPRFSVIGRLYCICSSELYEG